MKLFEQKEFENVTAAKTVKDETERLMKRNKIAIIVALIASGLVLLGLLFQTTIAPDVSAMEQIGAIIWCIAIGFSIASYIIGGGFLIALKCAGKIAGIGWLIIPFPFDIVTGFACLIFALLAFLFVPIIFVGISCRQRRLDHEAAVAWMNYMNVEMAN
ncbi:MAG: hypothetical protein K6G01_11100 [Eubacterium sp.]|nr:hypothetical protein [Eubacterium sp.]